MQLTDYYTSSFTLSNPPYNREVLDWITIHSISSSVMWSVYLSHLDSTHN